MFFFVFFLSFLLLFLVFCEREFSAVQSVFLFLFGCCRTHTHINKYISNHYLTSALLLINSFFVVVALCDNNAPIINYFIHFYHPYFSVLFCSYFPSHFRLYALSVCVYASLCYSLFAASKDTQTE